jgi:UDP-glucose 4-epimerase
MTMLTERVLVTGGAGFIGAGLVRFLLDKGVAVTVLDDLSTGRSDYLEGLDLSFIEGDVCDESVVARAVEEQSAIVHLAAQTGVPLSLENPRGDCRVNVVGTLNLLESARHSGVQKFVLASSNAVMGRQPPPAAEDKVPLPISPYGASKLAAEAYCLAYSGSWNLATIALRFGNVYGPFFLHKNSVVARFLTDFRNLGTVTIEGDGQQTRDFIFLEDLCRAIMLSLEKDIGGEVLQISTGVETSIRDLAEAMRRVVGRDLDTLTAPARAGDVRRSVASVSKASELLDWTPRVSLEEGLERTWEWFTRYSR